MNFGQIVYSYLSYSTLKCTSIVLSCLIAFCVYLSSCLYSALLMQHFWLITKGKMRILEMYYFRFQIFYKKTQPWLKKIGNRFCSPDENFLFFFVSIKRVEQLQREKIPNFSFAFFSQWIKIICILLILRLNFLKGLSIDFPLLKIND